MTPSTVPSLHRLYAQLTGWVLTMSYMRQWAWSEYIRRGHTEADLVKVVTHLRGEIRKGNRNPGCLKFHNLLEDQDRFEEELAMAGQRDRQFKERSQVPEGKRQVLRDTGKPEAQESRSAKPVSELISELRKAAGMNV